MSVQALYTIAFHELQFTAQIELSTVEDVRETCEQTLWFDEVVLKRMLLWSEPPKMPIGFQFGALDGLTSVWFGFWNYQGKCASFTLVKTRLR